MMDMYVRLIFGLIFFVFPRFSAMRLFEIYNHTHVQGGHTYTRGCFMSMYGKNHHSIVK